MKRPILLFILLLSQIIISQEKFLEINNNFKEGTRKVHTAFPVVDEATGNFAIFLDDDNNIYGFLYSAALDLIGEFASEGLPKKYEQIIGYSVNGKEIRLFLKDRKDKTFGSILFNFENKSTEETLYDFKLKNEVYVGGYSDASKFHLVTINKESSILNFYVFEEGSEYTKQSLDLSKESFYDNQGAVQHLYTIMSTGGSETRFGNFNSFKIDKIDSHSPNSIETTSEILKMYPEKHGFKLTIDTQTLTYIIDVSTEELNYTLSTIEKPSISAPMVNSNSFILDDKIYLISSSDEEMVFSIKSLETGKELKNLQVKKDEEIIFKNTPIIQEGGTYKDYREMEKSSKFLRRLSKEDIGVAVVKSNNDYVITMGSKKEMVRGGAPMMMPGFGMPMGAIGGFTVTFNPTFYAYGSYNSTKATRIECLFDQDFNHKSGDIPKNVFDIITESADTFPKKDAETVFKLNDSYIWGVYNKKLNQYTLFKF
ncbi:hypothetical protein [Flagellimonas sp.]|uniref:hypothetical protein n=1 Tax=Flagellimonas sp. TaxID=2058762 RepID=UPI003AB7DBBD